MALVGRVLLLLSCLLWTGCPNQTNTIRSNISNRTPPPPKSSWKLVKGETASDFRLRDLNNRAHGIKQYKGKVVLLNFWATWCAPCLKEFPYIQKLKERYKSRGLEILAVSTDEGNTVSQVGPLIYRYGYDFTVLLDPEGRVNSVFNPKRHCPFTALIDRKGQIRVTHQGYTPGDEKELEKYVIALLKERQ